MSLAKIAQLSSLDKDLLYITDEDLSVSDEHEEHKHDHEEPVAEIVVLKVDEDEPEHEEELSFELPFVPGGEHQEEIVDENELSVSEDDDKVEVVSDPWAWRENGLKNFLPWLKEKMDHPPSHSGVDSVGLERCIAYFTELNKIISQAVRTDLKNELNIGSVEKAREEIHKAIVRLTERLERINGNKFKKKKKSDDESDGEGFVKEAQKASKFMVTVSLLESHIARVCINATVSAGKSLEDTFAKLATKYKLSEREKVSVIQLLSDMSFPIRIREANFDENFDPTSSDNIESIQQFFA